MIDPRILEKITKCLSLAADDRGDPNTAAIALRQAQSLMAAHGVSESHIDASGCGRQQFKSAFSLAKPKDFENALVWAVANAFGCDVLWIASNSERFKAYGQWGQFVFIGPKGHVDVAQHTAIVLQRQLVKARAEFVRGAYHLPAGQKTKAADGFCHGWIASVAKTVDKFGDPDGRWVKAREAYKQTMMKVGPNVKSQERQGTADGWYVGKDAGAGVTLRRPVGAAEEQLKLGA